MPFLLRETPASAALLAWTVRHVNPSPVLLIVSAITLGHAIQITNGFYQIHALRWMATALTLAMVGGTLHRRSAPWSRSSLGFTVVLLGLGIAWQLSELFTGQPGLYRIDGSLTWFRIGLALQAAAVLIGLTRIRHLQTLWFPMLLTASLALGVWMIKA